MKESDRFQLEVPVDEYGNAFYSKFRIYSSFCPLFKFRCLQAQVATGSVTVFFYRRPCDCLSPTKLLPWFSTTYGTPNCFSTYLHTFIRVTVYWNYFRNIVAPVTFVHIFLSFFLILSQTASSSPSTMLSTKIIRFRGWHRRHLYKTQGTVSKAWSCKYISACPPSHTNSPVHVFPKYIYIRLEINGRSWSG